MLARASSMETAKARRITGWATLRTGTPPEADPPHCPAMGVPAVGFSHQATG